MAQSIYPNVTPTRRAATLTSGTSYTVPAGALYLNVTLMGGGGGGGSGVSGGYTGDFGRGGSVISSTLSATPGATITYAIGAGGGVNSNGNGGTGGTTSFTGATSAVGGAGGGGGAGSIGTVGTAASYATNGGGPGVGTLAGGAGGIGSIVIEYWV